MIHGITKMFLISAFEYPADHDGNMNGIPFDILIQYRLTSLSRIQVLVNAPKTLALQTRYQALFALS